MRTKVVLACALSVALVCPTFAANYYIVQNIKTHKCMVAKKKPKRKKVVLAGDGTAYGSKKRATTVMKTIEGCKS